VTAPGKPDTLMAHHAPTLESRAMANRHSWLSIPAAIVLMSLVAGNAHADVACEALSQIDFGTVRDAATQVTSATQVSRPDLPLFCRVEGYVSRQVGFELRMPVASWNQRLLFQGCGGFCGSVQQIEDCNDAIARGYACVTTDLGHKSTPIDAKWAYNNREAEIDFYFRATHVTTVAAKAILASFYQAPPEFSYLRGCSTGGRQGLVSAQRFPDDFDGVIAGAPAGVAASGGLHLISSALANRRPGGRPILAEADIAPLHEAVLDACDSIDGARDGILADPTQCHFDPGSLSCDGRSDGNGFCLSDDKISVVRRIYSGATDADGAAVYTAVPMRGSEPYWIPAYVRDDGPSIYYLFGGDFFRYLGFDPDPGPEWNPEDFDLVRDLPRMKFMRMLNNAANPDLTAFEKRGGKIILYQGWSDQSVPPLGTVEYYQLAARTMGGEEKLADMARLFMLPAVQHCRGGTGPDTVDYLSAIERWVERGEAPDSLKASRLKSTEGGYPRYPLAPSNIADQWLIKAYPGNPERR
jgi:feruloyl esterase